jgi:hypothetical protein
VALYLQLRPAQPRLLVGVDDDLLKWTPHPLAIVRRQRSLGAAAVRVWAPWGGEARPEGARLDELARAEQAAQHTHVVLAVFGDAASSPLTPVARARFCGYARAVLARVPDASAVVVWNEANSPSYWQGSAGDYERLLARCYDELHGLRPAIAVLDSTTSAHAPAAFLRALGRAYRASGRAAPLVDAFGHNPYPRTSAEEPWTTHASGFLGEGDYARLASTLSQAFAGTAQRSFAVWYLEDGYQSIVPARLARGYSGRENALTIGPQEQARRLGDAIRLAACQPTVRAFFNFELLDETRLAGWQSGLLWRLAGPKPAAAAFAVAARAVRSGGSGCSSLARTAAARP